MGGHGGYPWGRCRQQWREVPNIVSSAARSKRLAAAVQSAALHAFGLAGGTPFQYVMGGDRL